MPRRRNENGLKRQQRLESEQHRQQRTGDYTNADDRQVAQESAEPVPPTATQPFENLAPPITTPRSEE